MMKHLLALLLASITLIANADEGMWMLTDLKQQNAAVMYEMGLDIEIDKIYAPDNISLKDAVVHFNGGCTAEIISKNGLLITNHHCGYGAIQQHSSVAHDYLTDGFWAANLTDELPCKDLYVTFIDQIYDVTDFVSKRLKRDKDPEGLNYLSPSYLATVAERYARKHKIRTNQFTSLELKPFYGGNKYYLFVKTTYRDIRLVGTPPSSIGKFGADTDNWMWPRHCGDFSMFRIYASPDGSPSEYSAHNRPLQVKQWLTINAGGIHEGDFTFVMGFPGRNWRYMISDEVTERMRTTNFMRDTIRGLRLNVLGKFMAQRPETRIQYAAKYASSANYWKNAIGMNEGLISLKVLDRKRHQEDAVLAFASHIEDTTTQAAFDTIRSIVSRRFEPLFDQQAIHEALTLGTEFSKVPSLASLTDALKSGHQPRIAEASQTLKADFEKFYNKDYDPSVDREVSKTMLKAYASLVPAERRISIFKDIEREFGGDINAYVDACFSGSVFRSPEAFKQFLAQPDIRIAQSDLMARYAASVKEGYKEATDRMKAETEAYNRAHKAWVMAVMRYRTSRGARLYPDANSTLRLTYGKIGSYTPRDAVKYLYYTTLDGVMQKEDPDNPEFVVPERLKQLYQAHDFGPYAMADGRMPVCFVTATDNTGGNSGSPVFDSKGRLIGVGFDRNYEGLTGDIAYNPQLQRAACVDIRYILFIIDKFAGAQRLIDELDIVR